MKKTMKRHWFLNFRPALLGAAVLSLFALPVHAQEVDSYNALQAAASAGSGEGTIKLTSNILDGAIPLTIGRSLTLDLNGHSLTIDLPPPIGRNSNGIKINSGVTLTIKDSNPGQQNALTVTNRAGENNANHCMWDAVGGCAAINTTDGTLVIESGKVNATGGDSGAGIGGGNNSDGGTITITGGDVKASSNVWGAGIGGGYTGAGGKIVISGGKVTATGGYFGAGIGGGHDGGGGGDIRISNGNVVAKGGVCAAGIGGGANSAGGKIEISGGTIDASSDECENFEWGAGAGIGGGGGNEAKPSGASGSITISGAAQVTATGGASTTQGGGAGIGSGGSGSSYENTPGTAGAAGPISIANLDHVKATGGKGHNGRDGAAIGFGGGASGPGASVPTDGSGGGGDGGGVGGNNPGGSGGNPPPPSSTDSKDSKSSGGCSTSGGPFGVAALVVLAAFGWVRRQRICNRSA